MIILKDKTTISARVVQEDKQTVTFLVQKGETREVAQLDKSKVKKVKYEKIPKSVNVIIIQHEVISNEHLLNDLINHMIMSGYTIEDFNNDYFTVSTAWENNERITAQIIENEAFFRCFYREEDESEYPQTSSSSKITWGVKPKPGEKRGSQGGPSFKDLNDLCRSYLNNGMTTLKYHTEHIQ
jgi:hypothetical protein